MDDGIAMLFFPLPRNSRCPGPKFSDQNVGGKGKWFQILRRSNQKSCFSFPHYHVLANVLSIGYLECPEPEPDRLVIFGFMSTVRTKYFGVVPSTGVRISTRERETFERLRFNLAWRSTCIS